MVSLALTITIPKEDFYLVNSPTTAESVKQRLLEPREPKSPEALAKQEERAAMLHQAHIEAVAARAKRVTERVTEAKRRAAHMSVASAKAKETALEERIRRSVITRSTCAERRRAFTERRREFAEGLAERRAAREEAEAILKRASEGRLEEAASRRSKAVLAKKERGAYEVKHALAVAAACKEKRHVTQAEQAEAITSKLEAAAARRLDFGSPTTPKSPPAAKLAVLRNEQQIEVEEKKRRLEMKLESATVRRMLQLEETVSKARAASEKIEAVSNELASPDKEVEHRRQTFGRLCAADVRRGTAMRARSHKTPTAGVIEIDVPRGNTTPPAALLKRLACVPHLLAATGAARQAAAAVRRETQRSAVRARAHKEAQRAAAAAVRRAAKVEQRRASADFKMSRASANAKAALAKRAAAAAHHGKFLVLRAAAARAAAALAKQAKLERCAAAVDGAKARRDAVLATLRAAPARRVAAVAAKREQQEADRKAAGVILKAHLEGAATRRAAVLTARAGRARLAKLVSTRHTLSVKLTITAAGNGCGLELLVAHGL